MDMLLAASLLVCAFVMNAIGVHVSATPIDSNDSAKSFWRRRRTLVWSLMAVAIVLQISVALYQTYRQAESSKTLDNLNRKQDRLNSFAAIAEPMLRHLDQIASKPDNKNIEPNQQESNIKRQTVVQALRDAAGPQLTVASGALSQAQISLIGLTATDLVREIRQDNAAQLAAAEAIDRQMMEDAEKGYLKAGMTHEDARRAAGTTQVGSSAAQRRTEENQTAAMSAISSHRSQIDALIEIGKSDKINPPSSLVKGLNSLQEVCRAGPVQSVDDCVSGLKQVEAAAK